MIFDEQVFPEALPQTRGRRESGRGNHALPFRTGRLPQCACLCWSDRISPRQSANRVVCAMQSAITSEGDAWAMTLDSVSRFYERVLARKAELQGDASPRPAVGRIDRRRLSRASEAARPAHGGAASRARFRAGRSAIRSRAIQRHGPAFRFPKMRAIVRRTLGVVRQEAAAAARQCFARKRRKCSPPKNKFSRANNASSIASPALSKIRIHGDYHLGQVLYTGKDFIILDFEGEPRGLKRAEAETLGLARCRRNDAFLPIRRL